MRIIRKIRESIGISTKELADRMGVSPQAVGKWERGESFPAAAQLPSLAKILGCSIDALFDGEEQSGA